MSEPLCPKCREPLWQVEPHMTICPNGHLWELRDPNEVKDRSPEFTETE